MVDIAALKKMIEPAFPGYLGIELLEVTPERVVGALLARPELSNGDGILHGGALMALADTLGACATVVNLPAGARTTTIESKTNFLGAVPMGTRITGECTAFHRGKTTMVWQTRICAPNGRLCAVVSQTQLVLPPAGRPR
jgi:uncharacterized protein (TIGR00369 family)